MSRSALHATEVLPPPVADDEGAMQHLSQQHDSEITSFGDKRSTVAEHAPEVSPHPAADGDAAMLRLLQEYGDRPISFGERRGTVAEALAVCPHLKLLGPVACRGVIVAAVEAESRKQETAEEVEEAAAEEPQEEAQPAKNGAKENKKPGFSWESLFKDRRQSSAPESFQMDDAPVPDGPVVPDAPLEPGTNKTEPTFIEQIPEPTPAHEVDPVQKTSAPVTAELAGQPFPPALKALPIKPAASPLSQHAAPALELMPDTGPAYQLKHHPEPVARPNAERPSEPPAEKLVPPDTLTTQPVEALRVADAVASAPEYILVEDRPDTNQILFIPEPMQPAEKHAPPEVRPDITGEIVDAAPAVGNILNQDTHLAGSPGSDLPAAVPDYLTYEPGGTIDELLTAAPRPVISEKTLSPENEAVEHEALAAVKELAESFESFTPEQIQMVEGLISQIVTVAAELSQASNDQNPENPPRPNDLKKLCAELFEVAGVHCGGKLLERLASRTIRKREVLPNQAAVKHESIFSEVFSGKGTHEGLRQLFALSKAPSLAAHLLLGRFALRHCAA